MKEDLIDQDFFAQNTLTVARELLGMKLQYNGCEGIIVETEAYRRPPERSAGRYSHNALRRGAFARLAFAVLGEFPDC